MHIYVGDSKILYYYNIKMLILLFVCLLFWIPTRAYASIEALYSRIDSLQKVFSGYDFPRPEILLKQYRLKWFRDAIAEGRCTHAAIQLARGVRERYPDAPDVMTDHKAVVAFDRIVLPRFYPSIALCRALEQLREAQAGIDRKGLAAPRLRQRTDIDEALRMSDAERYRNRAIEDLINLALTDYAPGQLALARIAESGEIVRLTPEFTYTILARAQWKGLRDGDLDRLLGHASAVLTPRTRKALRPMIAAGKWPRWAPIIRD